MNGLYISHAQSVGSLIDNSERNHLKEKGERLFIRAGHHAGPTYTPSGVDLRHQPFKTIKNCPGKKPFFSFLFWVSPTLITKTISASRR